MKNSKNKNSFVLFSSLFSVLLFALFVGGCSPVDSATSDEKPISLSAEDLMKEYKENSGAADAKYKGKLLMVTGKVSGTLKTPVYSWISIRGDGSFNLADDPNPKGIGCAFDESEKVDFDKIKSSQKITVIGKNDGMKPAKMMRDGEYIALQNCRIQDKPASDDSMNSNVKVTSEIESNSNKISNTAIAETVRSNIALPDASTGKVPSDTELQIMLQKSIQDFADAVEAEDFTKFRENGSPWYKKTSAARYKEYYKYMSMLTKPLRWTKGRTATFSRPPSITEFKMSEAGSKNSQSFIALNLLGSYEDSGKSVKFEIQYNAVEKEWKINVISFNTSFRN